MPVARGARPWSLIPAIVVALAGCSSLESRPSVTVPIIFDWSLDGVRSIYRASLDGLDTERLTSGAADDEHPSERNGLVVFASYRVGHAELYAVAATGGTLERLTTTTANETEPALSPDGTEIAYLSDVSDVSGVTKLWLCGSDGSGGHALTAGFGFPGSIEASPSWSPTGDSLVFVSTANGSANLFVLDLAGGTPTPLLSDSSADVEPAWSPDGTEIAFASDRSAGGATNLYMLNVATRAITELTTGPGPDGQPAWLPDGRIVYTSFAGTSATLRWLDPTVPDSTVAVSTGSGAAENAVGIF